LSDPAIKSAKVRTAKETWLKRLESIAPPISAKIARSEQFNLITKHLADVNHQAALIKYITLFVKLAEAVRDGSGSDDAERIRKDFEHRKADAKTLRAAMRGASRRPAESLIASGRKMTAKDLYLVLRHTAQLVEAGGYSPTVRADMRKQTKTGDYFRAFTIREAGRLLKGMPKRDEIITAHLIAIGVSAKNLRRNVRALLKRETKPQS
jgi:hypothetical protein